MKFASLSFLILFIYSCGTAIQQNEPVLTEEDQTEITEGMAAHWISNDRLIWETDVDPAFVELRYSTLGDINVYKTGASGGYGIPLTPNADLSDELADKFRHISDRTIYEVQSDESTIKESLTGQIVAIAYDDQRIPLEATNVQLHGVIDDNFIYDGKLGPVYNDGEINLNLWAPTAQNITLNIYDDEKLLIETISPINENPDNGVWSFSVSRDFDRSFYRFDMEVYHHENREINQYEVTDPYSVSLTTDSRYSQFVDLENDSNLKPTGWDDIKKSQPKATDISLYESHMRDFSMGDPSVPEEHRGTYLAFTYNGQNGQDLSAGMNHLLQLKDAGLTHLHLLPINDIATITEDLEKRVDLIDPYSRLCEMTDQKYIQERCNEFGDTPIQEVFELMAENDPVTKDIQNTMRYIDNPGLTNLDGFNWGYDPFHFNVPQGSYSTNPEGAQRILETRKMVKALHEAGLKIVVDVVYNHTHASGMGEKSVLDKVVPGYFQRLNTITGEVETSTCCPNTAAEFAMMEKLIIDSIVLWAKQYKIDSFRFDLMGHHPKYVMENVKNALAELTLEDDGVDGENIYLYGEGWNFGEVENDRIFEQATQFNMGGSGIGNFNDRIRDAIKGGFFSWDGRSQGFANGRYLFPNEENESTTETLNQLLDQGDRIRVGMAGNLGTYQYENYRGDVVDGSNDHIGFTRQPQETINYIDKHDNETLWDDSQAKLPDSMSMEDRVRVHLLKNSFINFGQGIPFYQLGTDMLRSKSMDRNSYQSGDWFNMVDYSMESHNWGIGLPPAWDNQDRWDEQEHFLTNPNIAVEKEHMELTNRLFREQLEIRYSSPLFRLENAEQIHNRLAYHNTGPDQIPGIIAMTLSDGVCTDQNLDQNYDGILVLFNADIEERTIDLKLEGMTLHPIQQNGSDSIVKNASAQNGEFTIPALTTAVFVKPTVNDSRGDFPCNSYKSIY